MRVKRITNNCIHNLKTIDIKINSKGDNATSTFKDTE